MRVGGLILVAVLLAGPALAADGDFNQHIEAALHQYRKLEYEAALAELDRAKSLAGSADEEVLQSLLEGVVLSSLRREPESVAAFTAALELRPDAPLPVEASPIIRARLEEVRARVKRQKAAERAPTPPVAATAPAALTTASEAPPPPARGSGTRVAALVLFGAAVVAGGVSAATYARASQDAQSLAGNPPLAVAQSAFREGPGMQAASAVSLAIALAAAAGGGALYWVSRDGAVSAAVSPSAGGGVLAVRGTW